MNPPSGEAVAAAAPPNNSMTSSAAARRQMRHQLVQEQIAKITNQQETDRTEISQVMKPEPPKKSNPSFPTDDTGRVQVVEARGQRTCRIVVDTPAGHSAGRIKIVVGFERIEQERVAPKAPTRTAALQPVSTSVPLTTPTIREAPVFEEEETKQDVDQQRSIPSVTREPLQTSTIKAAPVMKANTKPDTKLTEPPPPPQKQSKMPQKAVDSKPKAVQHQRVSRKPMPEAETLKSTIPKQAVDSRKPAATHTKRVSIKQTPETIKPAAVETRSLAARQAATQQKTSTNAKPKAPPTSKKSKVPPSYQKAKPKVPPSHRVGKAKGGLTGIPASQRVTAKRNNLASTHLTKPSTQTTGQQKDNTSLDGNNSHATPLDKVESREVKQPENQKKLYHGRRKYAVEELQKMFEDKKLKGPSLQDAKEETLPSKNGVSKEKKKKPKKILKAFRA